MYLFMKCSNLSKKGLQKHFILKRSLECHSTNCKKTGSALWLKSGCKQKNIKDCKNDGWSIRTRDGNETWDDGNVFLNFSAY